MSLPSPPYLFHVEYKTNDSCQVIDIILTVDSVVLKYVIYSMLIIYGSLQEKKLPYMPVRCKGHE